MWIAFEPTIFETKDAKGLTILFHLLTWNPSHSAKRYKVFIEKNRVQHTTFYKGLTFEDQEIIRTEFDDFITEGITTTDYTIAQTNVGPPNPKQFCIEEAIRFFLQPVSIILENSKNDSCFIAAIIHHFGKQNVKDHLTNGWIQFENAGGCGNVENFIEGKLQSFDQLVGKYNKPQNAYFRGLVILDSDSEYPNHQQTKYEGLKKYLGRHKINYHLLKKRMMENYMPDEVFVEIKNGRNGQWIDTYLRLTDQQKDHFDIGKGFKKVRKDNQSLMKFQRKIWRKLQIGKDIRNFIRKNSDITLQLLPDVRKLYGITRHDLEILNSGLYRFPPHSKTTFPQLFEKPCVDKKTLGKRDGNNELEEIAQKINDLL